MRRRGLGAGVTAVLVALVIGLAAPAFAADAPTTTTAPGDGASTAPAVTTPPAATPPAATPPAATVPGSTTPEPTTPEPTTPTPATTPPTTDPARGDPSATVVNPVLTVTPSTDLTHLQSVTVSGTGFTPHVSVGWAECHNTNSGDPNDCDTGHSGFATTDASGAFSAPFTVRRTLHTNNGDVDCAAAPGTCNVGAAKLTDYSEHAGAPLTFDPNAPLPPPPTLLAGPLTNLHDGDSVALFGGGFVPSGQVAVVQCSQPTVNTCQVLAYLTASATGGFITTVQVHRVEATPPFGATDCAVAPGTCQLRAVSLDDYDFEAHVLLDFDPAGPLPTAAVTVTPDSGLVNFQSISVAGSGFVASGGVELTQCKSDATSPADCRSGNDFAPTTGTGTFSTTLSVRRVLHLAGGDFDCASATHACSIVASSYGPQTVAVVSPLDFDASTPLPPPPTIAVAPDVGLVSGQSVVVTGANFEPNGTVFLGQCPSDAAYVPYCGVSGPIVHADSGGSFTQTFEVRRGVTDFGPYPPAVLDCASAPGACSVVASSNGGDDQALHAVDFDPSAPLPTPDTHVSPQYDLPDRALVRVHSSGFAPGERVLVSQCTAGAPTYGNSCTDRAGPITFLQAGADGAIDTSIRVHREITPAGAVVIITANGAVNCSDAVGACVLRVQSIDDPLAASDVDLGFDPTAVAAPPLVTVDPPGPYTDGQRVEVHGSGYTPSALLGLAQCGADDPEGATCAQDIFTQFVADADGSFTRTVTLHTHVDTPRGPLDCSAAACVIFAANRADFGAERASAPTEFATDPDATTTLPVEVQGISQIRALAFTGAGSTTVPTAAVGVGLLVLGGALVLLARRRRAA